MEHAGTRDPETLLPVVPRNWRGFAHLRHLVPRPSGLINEYEKRPPPARSRLEAKRAGIVFRLRRKATHMSSTSVITITHTAGDVFVDATCEDTDDVSLIEALGMLDLARALLIEQAS